MLQVTERTPSARRNRRPRTRAKRILAAAGGFAIVLGLLGTYRNAPGGLAGKAQRRGICRPDLSGVRV